MLGVAIVVVVVGTLGEVFSTSIVLDIASLWPGLLLALLVAAALQPVLRRGGTRLAAVLPLLLLSWLATGTGLHLAHWSQLPSSAADLTGPAAAGIDFAQLSLQVEGRLALIGGDGDLYSVTIERQGGVAGVPEALERTTEDELVIRLHGRDGGAWFSTSGWVVELSESTSWSLDLEALELDLDLVALQLRAVTVAGVGLVRLPLPAADTPVVLEGTLEVEVPAGVAALVVGEATVPRGWEESADGIRSPGEGPTYRIEVVPGASVEVTTR